MRRKKILIIIILIISLFVMTEEVRAEEGSGKAKLAVPLSSILDQVSPLENGKCPTGYKKVSTALNKCYSNFYSTNVKRIKPANELDNTKTLVLISSDDSAYDIYVWQDDDTLYYYTDANYIYLDNDTLLPQKDYSLNFNWRKLVEIDLSKFNTSEVTDMNELFYGCSELEVLNVSSFDLTNVTNISSLFYDCSNLETLDISNFDLTNVTNTSYMMSGTKKLKNIKSPKNMGNSSIDLIYYYFDGTNYTNKVTLNDSNKEFNLVYTIYNSYKSGCGISSLPIQSCVVKYLPLESSTYGELPILEQDGYTFEGWYKKPYYYDEEKINNDTLLPDEYIVEIGAKFKSKTTDLGIELRTLLAGNFSSSGYENKDCPPGQIRVENSTNKCYCPFNQYSNIISFLRADTLDTTKKTVKISKRDSLNDVYVWQDGNTMYYYSIDDNIYFLSSELDNNYAPWNNLENIDLSSFDTSRIDDVSDMLKNNKNIKRFVTAKLLAGSTIDLPVTLYDSEFNEYKYISNTLKKGTVIAKKHVISFEYLDTTKNVLYGSKYGELPSPTIEGYNFLGWYKDSNYETAVYANTLFEEDKDIYLYAKLEAKSASLLEANTVSFKDNLSLNFLAEIEDDDLDGAYVKFKYKHYGENIEIVVPINVDDKNGKYYRFRCELTASEMMIPVTAELYLKDSNEPVSTWTRSIRDYIVAGIANSTNDIEKALFRATLNYGGYTQKRFNYNGEPYSYDDYKDDMTDVNIKSQINFSRPDGYVEGIKYYGASVFFRNAPYVRYYFELENDNIEDYTFKIDDVTINPTEKDGRYYIESSPVLAYQLDDKQRVIIKKNNTNIIGFNYSIIKWAQIADQNTTNDDERNMARAMYQYYLASKEFVESNI